MIIEKLIDKDLEEARKEIHQELTRLAIKSIKNKKDEIAKELYK